MASTGPLVTITTAGLGQQWGADPGQGYVTVTAAPAAPDYTLVAPIIGTDPNVPFPLQNAFYSLQWLIFAGAVVYVWVRFLREGSPDGRFGAASPTGLAFGRWTPPRIRRRRLGR